MSVFITGVRYNNDFRPSQNLDYLQGNIDTPISVEIDFNYQDILYAVEFESIEIEPGNNIVNLQDNSGVIYSERANAFDNYYIGDNVGVYRDDLTSYFYATVIEVIDSQTIRVSGFTGNYKFAIDKDFIFNSTPFAGLRYLYNLVESGGTFTSLIDGEEQKLQLNTLDVDNTTPQPMVFSGAKSYQIGSATVKGNGGIGGSGGGNGTYEKQPFTIVHTFAITPTFLPNQYSDFIAGDAPSYFDAAKCLNFIAELSLGRSLNNPNGLQTVTAQTNQSSTGFYNENYNGNPTNYSIKSLAMLDGLDPVTQLQFGKDITVEIVVENTVDAPFSNGNTQYMFGFNYLPEADSLVQKNGFDQTRNFARDYKLNVLGAGPQNGDNFGTPLQIIKTVTSTFISPAEMKVTAVINTGADADAILQQGAFARYKFWLITEDHTTTNTNCDNVNLIVDKNEFDFDLVDTNLIQTTGIDFIQHPYIDSVDATPGDDLEIFPVDDLVANIPFHIDFTGIDPAEEVEITTVQSRVLLKDTLQVQADILLEDFSVNTSVFPIVGGQAQNISYTQDQPFKIPDGEIRKVISIVRDYASDVGDDKYYNFQYPFFIRWEYWVEILNILAPPSDLFDPSLPFDGLNHFWQRLSNTTTWDLVYEVSFTVKQNGVLFTQSFEQSIKDSINFEGNSEWGNHTIDSYTIPGAVPIINGPIKYVRGYEDVEIRAEAEKVSGPLPAAANMVMVLWVEIFEQGGIDDARRISSLYPLSSQSWFKSVAVGGLTQVTSPSAGVYRATAILDYTKIPTQTDFTIYARFYEFFVASAKQFETGNDFEFEDDDLYELEDNAGGGGGGLTIGTGTAFKQFFSQQSEAPEPAPVKPASDSALLPPEQCCFEMPVFADMVDSSSFKNDYTSFIEFFNNGYSGADIKLQKFTGGAWVDINFLNDDTYGGFSGYGANDPANNIYGDSTIAYILQWQKVLQIQGTGTYRVMFTGHVIGGGSYERPSESYCLKTYDPFEIDNTVRIDYWTSGNIGDKRNDRLKKDFQTFNWPNQLRLPNSMFGFDFSEYEDEYTKYQNGEEVFIEDKQVEKYILKVGLIPNEFIKMIKIDILQSSRISITDYNESNPTSHTNKEVIRDSNVEPEWNANTLLAPVEIQFRQKYQNLEHKRC
jgi:hypothetical protein